MRQLFPPWGHSLKVLDIIGLHGSYVEGSCSSELQRSMTMVKQMNNIPKGYDHPRYDWHLNNIADLDVQAQCHVPSLVHRAATAVTGTIPTGRRG